jgi:hypothetical protein
VAGLQELTISIKNINRDYSTGAISPEKIKNLSKIKILTLLDQKTNEIELSKSKYATLYKLEHL